jgi:hypothetical protein
MTMGFQIQNPKNAVDAKRAAIEARKALTTPAGTNSSAIVRYIPPGECPDRNRIVFDDSGSMGGYIEDAKRGMIEYLRNCIPNQTSVAVHFMNSTACDTQLESNLLKLAGDIREMNLRSGGTPFFNTLKKALEATPTLTRLIAFTDGSPTDSLHPETGEEIQTYWADRNSQWTHSADVIIKIAHAIGDQSLVDGYVSKISGADGPCIPIDTVYFGEDNGNRQEMELLKYLSSKTGGYFLHFDPAKVNFAQAFKYLAPVNRLMLASASFRAQVESGAQK